MMEKSDEIERVRALLSSAYALEESVRGGPLQAFNDAIIGSAESFLAGLVNGENGDKVLGGAERAGFLQSETDVSRTASA